MQLSPDLVARLTPVLKTDPRPADPTSAEARYIRSFLWLRTLVGALGIALPLALVLVDRVAFDGSPFPRGSLSVYYYSGARELFVAIMSATGLFFVAYKIAERNVENLLSIAAGIAAVLIALFPTGVPSAATPLTPLQKLLTQSVVRGIHFTAAATFLVALMLISVFFGLRERDRAPREGMRLSPGFWARYHWLCAGTMALALIWIVVTLSVGWPSRSLLIGEWVSAWAFGASWLMKGLELDMLRGKAARPVEAPVARRAVVAA